MTNSLTVWYVDRLTDQLTELLTDRSLSDQLTDKTDRLMASSSDGLTTSVLTID